jgi:hypothetical protein
MIWRRLPVLCYSAATPWKKWSTAEHVGRDGKMLFSFREGVGISMMSMSEGGDWLRDFGKDGTAWPGHAYLDDGLTWL